MKGYLTTMFGVPTIITTSGNIKLDFDPPDKLIGHVVEYDKESKEINGV